MSRRTELGAAARRPGSQAARWHSGTAEYTHTSFIIMSNKGRLPALGLGAERPENTYYGRIHIIYIYIYIYIIHPSQTLLPQPSLLSPTRGELQIQHWPAEANRLRELTGEGVWKDWAHGRRAAGAGRRCTAVPAFAPPANPAGSAPASRRPRRRAPPRTRPKNQSAPRLLQLVVRLGVDGKRKNRTKRDTVSNCL
jgi:hypothetical protein